MKKGIVVLLIITFVFTVMAYSESKESIVICTSAEQWRNDDLQLQLNEKFPQYNIIVMYMPTGKVATKIYTEGKDTEVDIILALESGYMMKIKDHLADISGISRIDYLEGLAPENNDNKWVTWERFAGAIVVNTEILDKYGLEEPHTYEDLLKPEYKGLVAMPHPKSSSTGYFYYKNWVNTMGEKEALEYVDKLQENLKQFTESGSGPIKMLTQGEIAVGLGMTFQTVTEINKGQPFKIIYPPEGSPYTMSGTGIVEGHQDKEGVKEIYDFLVNEFILDDKEKYSPELIYKGQVIKMPNYPENIVYADMTGIEDDKEKERLLSLWKY